MLMNISMIPSGLSVADIGCDHGWVSIYLAKQGIAPRVIAMDVADGPLSIAIEHIKEAGLDNMITVKKSDGLCELATDEFGNPEADVVLIAGMGGHLAIRLIEDSIDKCIRLKYLILQIQSDIAFVRKRITELGFMIDDESMVLDEGKYYTAIRIVPNVDMVDIKYSEKELLYGPVLLEKKVKVLYDYLQGRRSTCEAIIEKIGNNSDNEAGVERTADVQHELELIDECLYEFDL